MESNLNKSFKKFLIIWFGEFVSSIVSGLTAFALAIYMFERTNSATNVALITLCAFLPSLLLSPLGGVLADKFDRRLMMILGDSLSAIGLVYILVCMLTGEIAIWQIYFGVTISSVFSSLMEPAYKATVTDLLSEEEFVKASGFVQVAYSSKYLLSPIIAGFLLSATNIEFILIIDICTFFVTVFTVLFVKQNMETKKVNNMEINFLKELKEGWQVITSTKGILILVFLIS